MIDLDLGILCDKIHERNTHMAYVAWIKSKKLLLKVQEGIGDNLLHEDIQRGYVDYILWSTFRPDYLDTDEELPPLLHRKRNGALQARALHRQLH